MKLVGLTLLAALSGRLLAGAEDAPQTEDVTYGELSLASRGLWSIELSVMSFQGSTANIDPGGASMLFDPYFVLGFNLARTARIDAQESMVTGSSSLQTQAASKLSNSLQDRTQCDTNAGSLSPASEDGFFLSPVNPMRGETAGRAIVQEVLDAALQALGSNSDEGVGKPFNPSSAPFNDKSVQNAAYMMFSASTVVGCAKTTDCEENEKQYILCVFTPTLEDGVSTPFPAALYNAMVARANANIKLANLTVSDLQTKLTQTPEGGGGEGGAGEGAASYALPGAGLLLFTFTGMLAF
ncbi:hypothetical protein Emag_006767 [Eimeria magna]